MVVRMPPPTQSIAFGGGTQGVNHERYCKEMWSQRGHGTVQIKCHWSGQAESGASEEKPFYKIGRECDS